MLRALVIFVVALAAVSCSDDGQTLKWPKKYSAEVSKISVLSGLVQDMSIWRTSQKSRIDYNQGAVKKYVIVLNKRRYSGTKIEIHPETSGDGSDPLVCHAEKLNMMNFEGPESLLPTASDFEIAGEEMMRSLKCTKFINEQEGHNVRSTGTLWAAYVNETWVPVRFEESQFNTWLGYIDRHDIWDFDNFDTDFSETDVFNYKDYCSKESSPIRYHGKNDEAVTKHLMFIDPENEKHVEHVFKAFKKTHNKQYKDKKEHKLRQRLFQNRMRLIRATNLNNLGYKLSVNKFADLLPEEMKRHQGLNRPETRIGAEPFPYAETEVKELHKTLPESVDLRDLGLVSKVVNQEDCGCCWTLGTTTAVQGALARSNGGNLVSLSNQAIIDCAWEYGAAGCDGGNDIAAYQFMRDYGMPTEAEYGAYTNQDGYCGINNVTQLYKIKHYVDVTPKSVGALKVAIFNHGPLSVSVEVTDVFSLYAGGVFYDFTCSDNPRSLNHEVSVVGYGSQDGDNFWILKNSWGQDWGISGYMHISAKDNNCGIMTEPTYVEF